MQAIHTNKIISKLVALYHDTNRYSIF